MADLQRLESAFLKAHKAGDTQAAGVLAAEIKRLRSAPSSSPNLPRSDVTQDVVKSGATGVLEGFAGLAQLPRDAGNFLGRQVGYGLSRLTGASPDEALARVDATDARIAELDNGPVIPSAARLADKALQKLGGYTPQTTAGEYARTVGQFAPAALSPGSALRRTAQVVVPGVASEAAGQATEGKSYEPLARMGGAILGGGIANMGSRSSTAKKILETADTPETIPVKTRAAYDQLKQAGINFDVYSYDTMAADAAKMAKGYRTQAPMTADAVDYINDFAGKGIGFDDLEDIRKNVTRILAEPSALRADKDAAGKLLGMLDDFYDNAPVVTSSGLPANQVGEAAKNARELGRRNIILKDIEEMVRRGDYYKSGEESGLNNQFLNYLKKRSKFLTPAERDAFESVGKGSGTLQNLVRIIGGFGIDPTKSGNISRLLPALGAGAGYGAATASGQDPLLGAVAGAGALAVGSGARALGTQMIRNNVKNAQRVVAAGKTTQNAIEVAKLKAVTDARARSALNALLAASSSRQEKR